MAREIKVFGPEERRHVENNLYCSYCGNANQWRISLRLKHQVQCLSGSLIVAADRRQTNKVLKAIEKNIYRMVERSLDKAKDIFNCANCHNGELDFLERALEDCMWMNCPGCFHCGQWISREDLVEVCSECIQENKGLIDEDDCFNLCPHYDFGLEQVRHHYGLSLDDLKRDLGYHNV